jgi:hypothetical protein
MTKQTKNMDPNKLKNVSFWCIEYCKLSLVLLNGLVYAFHDNKKNFVIIETTLMIPYAICAILLMCLMFTTNNQLYYYKLYHQHKKNLNC